MSHYDNGQERPEHALLQTAVEAAKLGGEVLLTHLSRVQNYDIEQKAEFDFATLVDHSSERAIIEHIHAKFPSHKILAEEGGELAGDGIYRWVIDPLDGTTNYLHGLRIFAVSIAVTRGDEPVVGVVYDPVRGETFTAEKGGGAYLNGGPIEVSKHSAFKECLLATGFPFRSKDKIDTYLESFKRFFTRARDIRRMGSAALDLAYIAAGRLDGFWELNLHRWDYAAGLLLVEEAGGQVTGFNPDENFWKSGNIVASNGHIHDLLTKELVELFPEL